MCAWFFKLMNGRVFKVMVIVETYLGYTFPAFVNVYHTNSRALVLEFRSACRILISMYFSFTSLQNWG